MHFLSEVVIRLDCFPRQYQSFSTVRRKDLARLGALEERAVDAVTLCQRIIGFMNTEYIFIPQWEEELDRMRVRAVKTLDRFWNILVSFIRLHY